MNATRLTKLLTIALLAGTAASAYADTPLLTLSTGVNGVDNNIVTTGAGTVDTNWTYEGYYDSYGLTRGQVFGSSVSNPNGAITGDISSPTANLTAGSSAFVLSGANRPGYYNPGDGSQWLSVSGNQANGGTPINPPGNYEYQLNLSSFINPNGGEVHISIGEINADNHFELAVGGSVAASSYLLTPFATQETWNNAGSRNVSFSFSPTDGALFDVIVANANDQLSNGQYVYEKNPTGFLIDDMVVTQDAGAGAPLPTDTLTSSTAIYHQIVAGSGPVNRQVVAAAEPGTWLMMLSFLGVVAFQLRTRRSAHL